jgi:(p)ppGpp synthase/HD superfamily hydrolase
MFQDQVFCFTPKGELIALPRGATPVDFAYAVHSEVGDTCVGAKINGRIMPLRTELQNGDQVDIINSKAQTPSPTWERFVVTGKARAASAASSARSSASSISSSGAHAAEGLRPGRLRGIPRRPRGRAQEVQGR